MRFSQKPVKILSFQGFYLLVLSVLSLACWGCSRPEAEPMSGQSDTARIKAVATVGMVADLVRNIGGDIVAVEQLMGAGVDPHLYKATRDDVAIVLSADVVFFSGLLLEGKMSDVLRKLGNRQRVVAVTDSLNRDELLSAGSSSEEFDPHVWMDVSLWRQTAESITNTLCELDSGNEGFFRQRFEAYQKQLDQLHEYAKASIATIPNDSRILITSHDAFSYLGRAYGLQVVGVQGLSTESEAGLQQINRLVDLLVERNVKAVFVESSVSQKNIMALIDGAKARGHSITIGAELYSDAMGPAGTYEGTYIGMIDHNITRIVQALGGLVPPQGFQGRLGAVVTHE